MILFVTSFIIIIKIESKVDIGRMSNILCIFMIFQCVTFNVNCISNDRHEKFELCILYIVQYINVNDEHCEKVVHQCIWMSTHFSP